MRLTHVQSEARAAIDRLTTLTLAPECLADQIVGALSIALPNDGYRLFGIDPTTLLINRLLAASDSDDWARREWLHEVYLRAEPLTYVELPNLMRMKLPVVANQERLSTCWGYPREVLESLDERAHYAAFHEVRCPVGGTLLASFPANGHWVASLQLYRRDASAPFRRTDVEFLRLLAPRIGHVLGDALDRERALALATANTAPGDVSGVVVLEGDGSVRFATPAAETWLSSLRDRELYGSGQLPTAVISAIAGLRSDTSNVVRARVDDGLLKVEASTAGPDGSVAIVLTRDHNQAPPPAPRDWPLTAQERQVVEHLIAGRSNAEIAAALFVSPNTVQTHLRHIYGKLEIGSRTQLLARYFREAFQDEWWNGAA